MLFGIEIQGREFTEKLLRRFVVRTSSQFGRGKAPEMVSPPLRINICHPLAVDFVPRNTAIARGVIAAQAGVGVLLGLCRKPQIRTAIIQPISVDVVRGQSIAWWEDKAMHIESSPAVPARCVKPRPVLDGLPSIPGHKGQVQAVDNGVLSLRQGNEDTILVHSVLLTLSAAPGAVLAAARNFLDFPNFSMVTRFSVVG